MTQARFHDLVREHLGPVDGWGLEAATGATFGALGALVGSVRRAEHAGHLPEPYRATFLATAYDRSLDLAGFVARVAASEHVPEGQALEHATAVLRALSVWLDDEPRRRLAAELPEDVRPWLEPPEEHPPTRASAPPPSRPTTHLSEARPGSRRPISETPPPGAQSGSVAAEGDAHAATKLSTARGTTQEREHETLAEAHPGPEHPVGD